MTAEQAIEANDYSVGRIRFTTATHPGAKRAHNEDALLCRPDLGLWIVADGAGGHSWGAMAAGTVVAALDALPAGLTAAETLIQVRLRLQGAHRALCDEAARHGKGLIASTVVVLILREDHFACLWAGDSRLYLARGGAAQRLTVDHSLVQDLLAGGVIGPGEARDHPDGNVITRAIGSGEQDPELEKRMGEVMSGDRFLLCSDGLCKSLSDDELTLHLSGGAVAEDLIAAALQRAVSDNVTAVLVDVAGENRSV
jgi:protein phosphatase/serine/threonine-protein phosphatase Stp1